MLESPRYESVVIISADTEWEIITSLFDDVDLHPSPLGQWFVTDLPVGKHQRPVLFFHGGWGKICAAASAQYVIDRWSPALLVNIGTCGGFEGEVERGTIILVTQTLVYDIIELMGDADQHIDHYATDIDLSWLRVCPQPVKKTLLVSADRDLQVEEISHLMATYGAVAGDWESGSIAYVSSRNGTRCLILRGVTDLVGSSGGDAYDGRIDFYSDNASSVLEHLVKALPDWLAQGLQE